MPGTFAYDVATNLVTITNGTSGSPADFASFITADRAGTGTSLRAAVAGGNAVTLTYPVRPVELRAIPVKCIVAGKTTETDYIFITGTDAWDVAQTESIDISAGNGTYPTVKRWRTITNIDCSDNPAGGGTAWANGTIAVTQDIWGVIRDLGSYRYQLDCKIYIGNGLTATYFKAIKSTIIINKTVVVLSDGQVTLRIRPNAVAQFGNIIDLTNKTTKDGCHFVFTDGTNYYNLETVDSGATLYLYGCSMICNQGDDLWSFYSGSFGRVWNCKLEYTSHLSELSGAVDINNCIVNNSGYSLRRPTANCSISNVFGMGSPIYFQNTPLGSARNIFLRGCPPYEVFHYGFSNSYTEIINGDFDQWRIQFNATCTNLRMYRRYSVNIKVLDYDKNPIAGAVVRLANLAGQYTNETATKYGFETTTDGSGNITEQIVTYGYYFSDDSGSNKPLNNLGPFTLTVTKDGYKVHSQIMDLSRNAVLEIKLYPFDYPLGNQ